MPATGFLTAAQLASQQAGAGTNPSFNTLSVLGDINCNALIQRKPYTVRGGPPPAAAWVGLPIFDTKYGIWWWYDGSAWHANGPGLIKSSMYRRAAWTPTTQVVVPYDAVPTGGDPLSLITLATSRFTCPIAGDYRVTTAALSVNGVTAFTQLSAEVNGSIVAVIGTGNSAGASEYAAANGSMRLLNCAAGAYLQLNLAMATYLAQVVGAGYCWAQFEFVSS